MTSGTAFVAGWFPSLSTVSVLSRADGSASHGIVSSSLRAIDTLHAGLLPPLGFAHGLHSLSASRRAPGLRSPLRSRASIGTTSPLAGVFGHRPMLRPSSGHFALPTWLLAGSTSMRMVFSPLARRRPIRRCTGAPSAWSPAMVMSAWYRSCALRRLSAVSLRIRAGGSFGFLPRFVADK